jgi:sialic acid synthase SpsE
MAKQSGTDVIAEFCQNHNGDFDLLARMIDAAAEAGATYGKMQTIFADRIAFRPQFETGVEEKGVIRAIKRPYADEYARLKGLEISIADTERFVRRCEDAGVIPMTTCFARVDAKPLSEIGFRAIKVASYDCASFPLLRELSDLFDEMIVSTGATYDDEIEFAASVLDGTNFSFLHCVTIYPTPLNELHLSRMKRLRAFSKRVGFSDHSLVARDGLIASKTAIYFGAEIVERHFTLLPAEETRDGPVSINAEQLQELVSFSNLSAEDQKATLDEAAPGWSDIVVGNAERKLSAAELLNRDYYRGRFASPRDESSDGKSMIFNWEETLLE